MQLHVYKDADELSHSVADWITAVIGETLKDKDRFTIALSGGSTPKALHKILASPPHKDQIDWSRLHVFWGDERDVPFEDERNNAKMAYDTLLNYVPVPASQVHIMKTDLDPDASAAEYEKILHQYFDAVPGAATSSSGAAGNHGGSRELLPASFDLVLLGMGDDGHTLSLFPGTEVVHEETAWVKAFYLKSQDMYRITLTRPIVNRSSRVAFLTAGAAKAHALQEVLMGSYNPDLYPSQTIKPQKGELHWFVDEAAAGQLK
jgi:6-phosphogluconolactonase